MKIETDSGAGGEDTEPFLLGDEPSTQVDLAEVISNLGPSVMQVLTSPQRDKAPVVAPMIYDPIEDSALEQGAVVLAVGMAPDGAEARSLIARAAAADAAAVAFKLHGRPCPWSADADEMEITVIAVADEMSWSHLHALLSLTIPSLRRATSMPGLGSVALGDLFALANAIAGVIGGAVTIEDQRARVLAYSNLDGQEIDEARQLSILGRQVPDTPGVRDLYKKLWRSDSVIRVDSVEGFDILPRLAAAVRVGKETLGSIWAVEGAGSFGPESEEALLEAARVAALHMIHARSSRDIERRTRGDLLRSLLEGRGDVESTAARLGIEPNSPTAVIAFEQATDDPAGHELYRERLVDLVAMYSEAFRLHAACVAIGRTVYALVPAAHMKHGRMKEIAQEIHDHAASALGVPLNTATSTIVPDLRDVPVACNEAERVLRVVSMRRIPGSVVTIDDVRAQVTLMTLKELVSAHPDLAAGPIEAIVAYDEEKGSSYLETLRAYLSCFGDVPAASEATNVHPNTFRYRLRRLTDRFNIDLDDPDERLVIELQLRIHT